MSNKIVYYLEDYLPLYKIKDDISMLIRNGNKNPVVLIKSDFSNRLLDTLKNSIISEDDIDQTLACPEWVNRNLKRGEFGEKIALKFLKNLGFRTKHTSIENSAAGYDIEAEMNGKKIFYEVKTTVNPDLKFHISYNELKVSENNSEAYNVFIVYINSKYRRIEGYIINDPIDYLNIDFLKLTSIYETSSAEIMANSFTVKLKQIISDSIDYFDLTQFLEN